MISPDDLADFSDLLPNEIPDLLRIYSPEPPLLAAEATQTEPGSPERVRIMAERFERGELIFHPDDLDRDGLDKLEQRFRQIHKSGRPDKHTHTVQSKQSA